MSDKHTQDGTVWPYRGPERRKGGDRRKGDVRREEIRFEPGKEDRRSGKDRRKRTGWDGALLR
ncbi:MAG: hypothetical protein M3Q11_06995 [Pseudomonadota bacterium]|nr:hypothetical protein [Pseudomonadota bacterium]